MLFFRSLFCLLLSLFLVSCGFQPLHQAHMGPSDICYPIKIATIKNREGQILRNYLVDIITPQGTPQKPEYLLEVDLTTQIENVGINKDETTSRKKATLTANFRLKDI